MAKNKVAPFFRTRCILSYLISVPFFFFVDCRVRVRVSSRVRDSVSFIFYCITQIGRAVSFDYFRNRLIEDVDVDRVYERRLKASMPTS